MLGQRSDTEISQLVKVVPATVRKFRKSHGISKYRMSHRKNWQPSAETAAFIGRIPDVDIAALENVDSLMVTDYRRKHRIEPFRYGSAHRNPLSLSDLPFLMDFMSDKKLARLFGFESTSIIAVFRQQMGK